MNSSVDPVAASQARTRAKATRLRSAKTLFAAALINIPLFLGGYLVSLRSGTLVDATYREQPNVLRDHNTFVLVSSGTHLYVHLHLALTVLLVAAAIPCGLYMTWRKGADGPPIRPDNLQSDV